MVNDTKLFITRSCNKKEELESVNITGKIVLCSSRSAIANSTLGHAFVDAITRVVTGGAIGLIYAKYTTNILEDVKGVDSVLPIVLVDYELAQRIASYASTTR